MQKKIFMIREKTDVFIPLFFLFVLLSFFAFISLSPTKTFTQKDQNTHFYQTESAKEQTLHLLLDRVLIGDIANINEILSELKTWVTSLENLQSTDISLSLQARVFAYYARALLNIEQGNRSSLDYKTAEKYINTAKELLARASYPEANLQIEVLAIDTFIRSNLDDIEPVYLNIQTIKQIIDQATSPYVIYYVYRVFGQTYNRLEEYQEALTYFTKAHQQLIELPEEFRAQRQVTLLRMIANVSIQLRDFHTALRYTEEALTIALNTPTLERSLSALYTTQGYIYSSLSDHHQALNYFLLSQKYSLEQNTKGTLLLDLNNIGATYFLLGEYEKARYYLEKGLSIAHELNSPTTEVMLEYNISLLDLKASISEHNIQRTEHLLDILKNDLTQSQYYEALNELIQIYIELELYPLATTKLVEQKEIYSQLSKRNKDKSITELQFRYSSHTQAANLQYLEQKNRQLKELADSFYWRQTTLILFALFIIITLLFLAMAWHSARQKTQALLQVNERLKWKSEHDELTQVLNRRSFTQFLKNHNKQSQDSQQPTDAILLLDIDYFKTFNDSFGHTLGDAILYEFAQRLKESIREQDKVVRWGGEEFLIYLHDIETSTLIDLVSNILHTLAFTPFTFQSEQVYVTASLGFIPYPMINPATTRELDFKWQHYIQLADEALYIAKEKGRNRAFGIMSVQYPVLNLEDMLLHHFNQALNRHLIKTKDIIGPAESTK